MTEAIEWLNQNEGAVIAVLTAFLVLFNAWLLLETRAVRMERLVASVEAYPMPYEMASMYLSGRVENGGPAIARDLVWTVTQRQGGEVVDEPHRYAQPLMAAGRYRTMMLHQRQKSQMLREMGEQGVTFEVEWEWKDGRRWLGVGPHRTHKRSATWDAKQLSDDFYQAIVLTETPPMLKVSAAADEMKKAAKEPEKIRRELERLRRLAERALHEEEPETGPE